jgi:DNA-directed RNA polymerase specialized sigma subunit
MNRQIRRAKAALEKKHGRPLTDAEIANLLRIDAKSRSGSAKRPKDDPNTKLPST